MSPDGSTAESEPRKVKYPFEFEGRWPLRYHVPYAVVHEGRTYQVLADLFAEPSVHGRITISHAGELVARHDDLTPGDTVEITGDTWRVRDVEYRTRVVLVRAADRGDDAGDDAGGDAGDGPGSGPGGDGPGTDDDHGKGATDAQAGR
ncbi:hypothetical protein ACFWUQ_16095 [Streptomyces sp. NPDC058662]|uniref:hypothetical protein n=1 Tax=Streptomyces sp. NPDC058662 TaxID=3346583 RepID=UPI0036666A40